MITSPIVVELFQCWVSCRLDAVFFANWTLTNICQVASLVFVIASLINTKSSSRDCKQYTKLVSISQNVTYTPFALWLLNTMITGSMVPEWFVLPPHSKVPLFESWPWSFECGVCIFWLCLYQFPTTLKGAACFMLQVVVVKQPPSVMSLTMELKGRTPHFVCACVCV